MVAKPCASIDITVDVENSGSVYGADEIIQVYLRVVNATVVTDQIRLVNFTRVNIGIKKAISVSMRIEPDQMTVTESNDYMRIIEPTMYEVYVGGNLDWKAIQGQPGSNMLKSSFKLAGSSVPISQC